MGLLQNSRSDEKLISKLEGYFQCNSAKSATLIHYSARTFECHGVGADKIQRSLLLYPKFAHGFKTCDISKITSSLQQKVPSNVSSRPNGSLFSVENDAVVPDVDKSQSIGINFGSITVANFAELTELDNTEGNCSSFDDEWAEIILMLRMEQELECSAIVGCNQTSDLTVLCHLPDEESLVAIDEALILNKPKSVLEISPTLQMEQKSEVSSASNCNKSELGYCLPDEGSLIAFNDMIIPQQPLFSSDGHLDYNKLPLNGAVYPGYYGLMNPGSSIHIQYSQKFCPVLHHFEIEMGSLSCHALGSNQAQRNSQTKLTDPKTTPTLPVKHQFDAEPRRPEPPICCYQLLQQPMFSGTYHQNELLPDLALPYLTGVASHAQVLDPMLMSTSGYQDHSYEGFNMLNPDHVGGGVGYRSTQQSYSKFTGTSFQ
ncbi:hypothetical protein NMG60_11022240 [Bertholletia excelsa]